MLPILSGGAVCIAQHMILSIVTVFYILTFYNIAIIILIIIKCGKITHFIKCRRRSVTNLADFTIGLPGSLNVRVLCSIYRTSHIREETRL